MASLKLITIVSVFIFLHLIQYIAMSKVVLAADETGRLAVLRSSLVDVEKGEEEVKCITLSIVCVLQIRHLYGSKRKLLRFQEIYDGIPAAVEEVEDTRILGRKMVPERNLGMVRELVLKSNGERRLRSTSSRGHVKVKIAGFIPFNADYHVPKPHPPKNN